MSPAEKDVGARERRLEDLDAALANAQAMAAEAQRRMEECFLENTRLQRRVVELERDSSQPCETCTAFSRTLQQTRADLDRERWQLEKEREGRLAAEDRAKDLAGKLDRRGGGVWGWLRRLGRRGQEGGEA